MWMSLNFTLEMSLPFGPTIFTIWKNRRRRGDVELLVVVCVVGETSSYDGTMQAGSLDVSYTVGEQVVQ
jgi:hypothetical protein